MSRWFGRPDHRPVVSAKFSAEIVGGGLRRRILAGRTNARWFGRPDHRPVVSAKFSAKILGGGLGRPISAGRTTGRWFGRPSRPAERPPTFSAEDHRRASPPFHSDELPLAPGTSADVFIWDGYGPSRTRGDFFDLELLNSQLLPYYATCFVGKMCSPTWSTWGASP